MKNVNMKSLVALLVMALLSSVVLIFADTQLSPIINENAIAQDRAQLVRIFPDADTFSAVDLPEDAGSLQRLFLAEGHGYIYFVENPGYAAPVGFIVGLDLEGNIVGYEVTELNDTEGIGTRIKDPGFVDSIVGRTSVDAFATIAGATVTSQAVTRGLEDVKAHYNDMMGIEDDGSAVVPEPDPDETPALRPIELGGSIPLEREVSANRMGEVVDVEADGNIVTYTVNAPGYSITDGGYDGAKPNVVKVVLDVEAQVILSVEILEVHDTPNIGDDILHPDFLGQFENLSYAQMDTQVDTISYATVSSTSVINAVLAAILAGN